MSPTRRRRAALRVVAGVALVAAAGTVVIGTGVAALLDADHVGWTTVTVVTGVLAVLAGAIAVRLTHTELLTARRRHAADRAEQARAYAAHAARREADHRRHAHSLQARIDERQLTVEQLQEMLVATQRRLAEERRQAGLARDVARDRIGAAERRADDADQRAAEAIVVVAELEQEIIDLQATLAAWEDSHPGARPVLRSAV